MAGGLFALIIALGLVAEFADQTHTARHILWYEDAVAAGGILGNLISIYQFPLPFGEAGAGIFGIFAGVFVGAWAMALTEIINIIPIFARRLDFRRGLELPDCEHGSGTDGRGSYFLLFWFLGLAYQSVLCTQANGELDAREREAEERMSGGTMKEFQERGQSGAAPSGTESGGLSGRGGCPAE